MKQERGYSKKDGIFVPDPMNYHPIRKGLNFDPSPVAGNIPFYADAIKNPKSEGTPAFEEFWDEQFDRCINGYETGGIFIPGRYYFYLNFTTITGVFGKQFPWFVDIDLEFFRLVEYVKAVHKLGIVMPKARRKGASEKIQAGVINHGLRFIESYKGGIAAGDNKYVTGFRDKMDVTNKEIRPELKLNILRDNKDEIKVGYEILNAVNQKEDSGCGGIIKFATMFDRATKLEGEYFHDVMLEESGQFPLVTETVESIKPALMMGSETRGTFYVVGTGGNILSSSKGFQLLWNESETFQLERFYISGRRLLYPFLRLHPNVISYNKSKGEAIEEHTPNLNALKWTDNELIGCEDVECAEKWILEKTEEYSKLPNKKNLIKHKQSFPISVKDTFTSGGSNKFNAELLYSQKHFIYSNENEKFVPGDYVIELEKVKDKYGLEKIKFPLKATYRLATSKDKSWEIVKMLEPPLGKRRQMDHVGVDSYEMDDSQTSTSLGGIIVLRDTRLNEHVGVMSRPGIYPVLIYYERPPRKEYFFEMALKVSVLFNCRKKSMLSAEHESTIDYYKKNGGAIYLASRPKALDSPKSKLVHKWGTKMTPFSKPRFLSMIQTYVEDYFDMIMFVEIIDDILAYDEENMGNDWDLTDALGNALTSVMKKNSSDSYEDEDDDEDDDDIKNENISDSPVYYYDRNGKFVIDKTMMRNTKHKKERSEEGWGNDYVRC